MACLPPDPISFHFFCIARFLSSVFVLDFPSTPLLHIGLKLELQQQLGLQKWLVDWKEAHGSSHCLPEGQMLTFLLRSSFYFWWGWREKMMCHDSWFVFLPRNVRQRKALLTPCLPPPLRSVSFSERTEESPISWPSFICLQNHFPFAETSTLSSNHGSFLSSKRFEAGPVLLVVELCPEQNTGKIANSVAGKSRLLPQYELDWLSRWEHRGSLDIPFKKGAELTRKSSHL